MEKNSATSDQIKSVTATISAACDCSLLVDALYVCVAHGDCGWWLLAGTRDLRAVGSGLLGYRDIVYIKC